MIKGEFLYQKSLLTPQAQRLNYRRCISPVNIIRSISPGILSTSNKLLELSITEDWFSRNLFSYLDLIDVSRLDSSLTCHNVRRHWFRCIKPSHDSIQLCNDDQADWCIIRNIIFMHKLTLYTSRPFRGNMEWDELSVSIPRLSEKKIIRLASSCEHLKHFIFKYARDIIESSFLKFLERCPVLQTLSIESKTFITPLFLDGLGKSNKYLLQLGLEMHFTHITEQDFEMFFKQCVHLREIKFIHLYCSLVHRFPVFKLLGPLSHHCQSLESLHLGTTSNLSFDSIDSFIQQCPFFKTLKFEYIEGITDNFLIKLRQLCPQLENITFGDFLCPNRKFKGVPGIANIHLYIPVTNNGLISFFRSCPLLKTLVIDWMPLVAGGINDFVFEDIARLCPLLSTVYINNVSNFSLSEFGKLNYLKHIHIYNFLFISDEGIRSLVSRAAHNHPLESIHITINNNVTQTSILTIADHCPFLKHITVSPNKAGMYTDLSKDSIKYLLSKCPKITHLYNDFGPEILRVMDDMDKLHVHKHVNEQPLYPF